MSSKTGRDDSKIELAPALLDLIDEQWLEDSLEFDECELPLQMRLISSDESSQANTQDDAEDALTNSGEERWGELGQHSGR